MNIALIHKIFVVNHAENQHSRIRNFPITDRKVSRAHKKHEGHNNTSNGETGSGPYRGSPPLTFAIIIIGNNIIVMAENERVYAQTTRDLLPANKQRCCPPYNDKY